MSARKRWPAQCTLRSPQSPAPAMRTRASVVTPVYGSYLVPDPELDRFKRVVSRLAVEHPELAIVCTGPWPPYSFVDDGASGP